MATIEAYNRRINLEVEMSRQNAYASALLTIQFLGMSLGKEPLPSYDACFATGSDEYQKEQVNIYEQQWKAYAIEHNRRRNRK